MIRFNPNKKLSENSLGLTFPEWLSEAGISHREAFPGSGSTHTVLLQAWIAGTSPSVAKSRLAGAVA